jgi:hypothetical protein
LFFLTNYSIIYLFLNLFKDVIYKEINNSQGNRNKIVGGYKINIEFTLKLKALIIIIIYIKTLYVFDLFIWIILFFFSLNRKYF